MQYNSPRIKIIDKLSYPGLAIKGIAAVGPTLNLYASMEAYASIHTKVSMPGVGTIEMNGGITRCGEKDTPILFGSRGESLLRP
jgi:hypothetical protein